VIHHTQRIGALQPEHNYRSSGFRLNVLWQKCVRSREQAARVPGFGKSRVDKLCIT
jgi:hypothetical protein